MLLCGTSVAEMIIVNLNIVIELILLLLGACRGAVEELLWFPPQAAVPAGSTMATGDK